MASRHLGTFWPIGRARAVCMVGEVDIEYVYDVEACEPERLRVMGERRVVRTGEVYVDEV